MKEKNFNNLMRRAFDWIEKQKKSKLEGEDSQSECLSEETICDYLESRLPASELERVEDHLALCSDCRQLITTLVKLEDIEKVESDGDIKAKSGIVTKSLKICLAWIQGHLTLKETDAESLPFWNALQPALVRGDSRKHDDLQQARPTIPPFSKTFKEYKVVVQVGEEEKGKCEIRCQLSPLAKKSLSLRIRVDLLQAERTLSSYPLENDTVLFNGIEPGEYKIKIREADRELALLAIDILKEDME